MSVSDGDDVHDGPAGDGGGDLAKHPRHLLALDVEVLITEDTSSGHALTAISRPCY